MTSNLSGGRSQTHSLIHTTNPAAQHIHTGRKHIDTDPIVRKVRPRIRDVRRTDGAHARLTRRRIILGIIIAVPRGDRKEHPGAHRRSRSAVDRRRLAAAQAHVGDAAVGALARGRAVGRVRGDKVDACQHGRDGAGAVGVEHLDGEELGLLSDTVGHAADGAGYVRAVACAAGGWGGVG